MQNGDFSEKLKLVLKVLVVSRAGLASELNVDKSLTGRWASGAVKPSEHNLAKITRFVASRIQGFTLLDWDRDLDNLREFLGVTETRSQDNNASAIETWIPETILNDALHNGVRRGSAYDGIWKSTRASNDLPGRYIHDICFVRTRSDGLIEFRLGVARFRKLRNEFRKNTYRTFSVLLSQNTVT